MLGRLHVSRTVRQLALSQQISCHFYSNAAEKEEGHGVVLHNDSSRTIRDFLTPSRVNLLDLTISPYLPTTNTPIPRSTPSILPPAFHFIFFPTSTSELDTLEDGYEKHFAPRYLFKRRVWTQGRLEFGGKGLLIGKEAKCVEKVSKMVRNEKTTDVWIERTMNNAAEEWSVKEHRCLRYLHDIPAAQNENTASTGSDVPCSGDSAILLHKFTPSQVLLTRFSYLTHNFHRIHIDQEYARTVEQYPDTLVHGSLSITLILTILRQHYKSQSKTIQIQSAKYVMYRPLYVNNPVTLTIAPTKSGHNRAILWDNQQIKAVECIINHVP